MSVSSSLLFDHCLWLLLLMPCLGLILTYFTKRTKPYRKNGKIYRHDVAARVEHWPHALGTLFLLISGIIMGLSFFISFISASEEAAIALNVHFVAACAFLFGTFYYIGNAISEPARMKEHLPNKDAISSTLNHYGAQLGFKRAKYPKEKKYFQSENMAYVFALSSRSSILSIFLDLWFRLQRCCTISARLPCSCSFLPMRSLRFWFLGRGRPFPL